MLFLAAFVLLSTAGVFVGTLTLGRDRAPTAARSRA